MQIAIVYDSGYGHTAKLAEAVAEGAHRHPGTKARLIAMREDSAPWTVLEASAAIIFGSPTYNGIFSVRLKQFFEEATKPVWHEMKWCDKLNALVSMALTADQHGMIWVGLGLKPGNRSGISNSATLNRLGSWIGAMVQTNVE